MGLGCTGGPFREEILDHNAMRMQRPALISCRPPAFTRAEGVMKVKCMTTTARLVEDCKVINAMPHMEEEVLATRRYVPLQGNGQPVAVRYLFSFCFVTR